MTSRALPILVLLLVPALCAGCRSDGGFGREDSVRGRRFASDRVASRFQTDCKRTVYLLSSIPSALDASMEECTKNVRETYHLYLENHQPR